MDYFRESGYDVERLRQTGEKDEGDLLIRTMPFSTERRFVVEAKRRKTLDLSGWVAEAEAERDNYVKHRGLMIPVGAVVIHKARNKGIGKSYVTQTLDDWMETL